MKYKLSNRNTRRTSDRKKLFRKKSFLYIFIILFVALVGGSLAGAKIVLSHSKTVVEKTSTSKVTTVQKPVGPMPSAPMHTSAPVTTAEPTPQPTAITPVTVCSTNNLAQLAIISVNKRHMWVCEGARQVYESAVITGMENIAADLTPRGTYHIYSMQTNVILRGSDTTGSWNDPVSYWMPFLSNKYGVYGFHDATWRAPDAFGNVDPNSSDASHGCIELPLSTASWLYKWSTIGTTLMVKD